MKTEKGVGFLVLALGMSVSSFVQASTTSNQDWSKGEQWALTLELDRIKQSHRKQNFRCQLRNRPTFNNYLIRINDENEEYRTNRVHHDIPTERALTAEACARNTADNTLAQIEQAKRRFTQMTKENPQSEALTFSEAEQQQMLKAYTQLTQTDSVKAFLDASPD